MEGGVIRTFLVNPDFSSYNLTVCYIMGLGQGSGVRGKREGREKERAWEIGQEDWKSVPHGLCLFGRGQ